MHIVFKGDWKYDQYRTVMGKSK